MLLFKKLSIINYLYIQIKSPILIEIPIRLEKICYKLVNLIPYDYNNHGIIYQIQYNP
jgi:hypothetical protein